ncbi:MAG: hypothetical protein L0H93_02265 [Nocardioides sp.]|nr:hypothetical protein [Nocardioides sp.]
MRGLAARLMGALLACLVLAGCAGGEEKDATKSKPESVADCAVLKNLVILAWADGAGLVPPQRSTGRWVRQHPDAAGFDRVRTDGGAVDVTRIWQQREQHPDPWNDLLRYYQNAGLPWLYATSLDNFIPGSLDDGAAHGPDPLGWSACPESVG